MSPHEQAGDGLEQTLASTLAALAATRFTDVRHVAETGSTNSDLVDLAKQGVPEGAVLVADHQTAGRGRLGRTWQAPPGSSLLVSILLRPNVPTDEGHLITTALGIAAAEACGTFTAPAGVTPRLKWPNDLVIGEPPRKLSGMLAESVVEHDRITALVLGIGINVNWPADLPDDLAEIAIALNHVVGEPVDRAAVLVSLLQRFDAWYGEATAPEGVGHLLGRYRQLSATLGSRVRVDLGGETIVGDAIDITREGHLLVVDDCPDRPREIVAGDVVHLR